MQFSPVGIVLSIIVIIFLVYVLFTQRELLYTFAGWIYVAAIIYLICGIFGWLTPTINSTFAVLVIALLLGAIFEAVYFGARSGSLSGWSIFAIIIALIFIVLILWSYSHTLSARPSLWFLALFTIAFLLFSYFTVGRSNLGQTLFGDVKAYYYLYIVALVLIATGLFYAFAKFVPNNFVPVAPAVNA